MFQLGQKMSSRISEWIRLWLSGIWWDGILWIYDIALTCKIIIALSMGGFGLEKYFKIDCKKLFLALIEKIESSLTSSMLKSFSSISIT